MCDLLGLSFNIPVTAKISLNVFQQRGETNPDGWGVAFYHDKQVQVIKETQPAVDNKLFDFVEQYPQTQTLIAHVRRSTRGVRSYLNTHPFYRLLISEHHKREFAFAHNGTLVQEDKFTINRFIPIGETDSEHAFCFILESISGRGVEEWNNDSFQFVERILRDINDGQNTLNCIFSDGEYLFCYSDENDFNNGLRFVKQTHPFGTVELNTPDSQLGSINIQTMHEESAQAGYIISTRILTKELWTEFERGELIVFRNGDVVYPTNRV